jgi:hypothetical protein
MEDIIWKRVLMVCCSAFLSLLGGDQQITRSPMFCSHRPQIRHILIERVYSILLTLISHIIFLFIRYLSCY